MQVLHNDPQQLEQLLNKSRLETRQLYTQIDKVKSKLRDTTLPEASADLPKLSGYNLSTLQVLKGHNNKIADFKWSKDSNSILSCSQDGFLIVWDAVTGYKLNAVPLDSQWVLACGYSPNGRLVASAGLTNNCTVYRITADSEDELNFQQRIVSVFKGHTCGITCCDFITNTLILTASGDMSCICWDLNKGQKIKTYLDHFGDVLSLDVDDDSIVGNNYVFGSGSSDGYARIWDSRSERSEQNFFVSNSDVTSLKFFKDGNSIVTGSDDGIIRLFDLRADCELSRYSISKSQQRQKSNIYEQTFFNDRRSSLTNSLNSTIENSGVTSLDFSNSGRLMLACYSEQGCIVWDTLRSEVVGSLEGHSNRVSKVATSPNGLGVCTGSWDTTMRVWTPGYE